MQSTMQDYPLTIGSLFRHGRSVYGRSEVVTWTGGGAPRRATFLQVADNAARLAGALAALGVDGDQRVATFMWNNQEHLEAYLAVPSMGAVLHTLNIRLFPEQLVYIANHAEDKIVLLDASLAEPFGKMLPELKTVEHVVLVGEPATAFDGAHAQVHSYAELLAGAEPYTFPDELDERAAAAMCYTSGTTGNPKGVVYSHRSAYLHSMQVCMNTNIGLRETDRVLPVVPMFHANAWGLPYGAWLTGADLLLPDRFLSGEQLAAFVGSERATVAGGVPTIFADLLRYATEHRGEVDLSTLRVIPCGGSAVPRALIEAYSDQLGLYVLQAWGMTETSPVASTAVKPKDRPAAEEMDWRSLTGRMNPGVDCRVVADDGTVLASDGEAVGEFEVRGPWVTGAYYKGDDPTRFHDGWLRTGDVGSLDDRGYMKISDRSKDVIKSGGEWISSVDLENALMAHPDVVEAAVVAVPDERWQERPLASVVVRPGAQVTAADLREFLSGSVARWQLPERWAFIEAVPKTSVGKFDKKVLRSRYADGALAVVELD